MSEWHDLSRQDCPLPALGEVVDGCYEGVLVRDAYLSNNGWYTNQGFPAERVGKITHWAPKRRLPKEKAR